MLSKRAFRILALAATLTPSGVLAADPSVQDMQVVGRAISFKDGSKRSVLSLAVVFNGKNASSQHEMRAVVAALQGGLKVGEAVLRVVAVEQSQFDSASGHDGVFTTADVDQAKLRSALSGKGVPCFSLDAQQVKNGACTIAVRSRPSVAISINSKNAAAADVRFATAFIMMVREI